MTVRDTHLIAATAAGFHTDEPQDQKHKGAANAAHPGQGVSPEPWSPPMRQRQAASPSWGLIAGKTTFFFFIQGFASFRRCFPED